MMPIFPILGELLLSVPFCGMRAQLVASPEGGFKLPKDRFELEDAVFRNDPPGEFVFELRREYQGVAFGPDIAQDFAGFCGEFAIGVIDAVSVEQSSAQYMGVKEDERKHGSLPGGFSLRI